MLLGWVFNLFGAEGLRGRFGGVRVAGWVVVESVCWVCDGTRGVPAVVFWRDCRECGAEAA